jgi:hypothetical protein
MSCDMSRNATVADDHKIYYPGATPSSQRLTADAVTRKLLAPNSSVT